MTVGFTRLARSRVPHMTKSVHTFVTSSWKAVDVTRATDYTTVNKYECRIHQALLVLPDTGITCSNCWRHASSGLHQEARDLLNPYGLAVDPLPSSRLRQVQRGSMVPAAAQQSHLAKSIPATSWPERKCPYESVASREDRRRPGHGQDNGPLHRPRPQLPR